jgi:peptide subunit release factor 1 (eRF1)
MATTEQLATQLDRLASVDVGPFPVVSLYLNLQPNEHGRDQFEPFLRKELAERVQTYPASGPERDSLEQDAAKIRDYVSRLDGSVNGLALFTSSGADLFVAIPLAAPVDAHRLYIANQPHLYPLARILDEYPRYLAVLTDTHAARIFVFATNTMVKSEHIENPKTKHHKQGGWAQARYQRHTENVHLQHAKEVVDAVERIMREEAIDKILVSADDVILPLLREQLPKPVAARIVEMLKMDVRAPEHEVLARTMAALRERDAVSDREHVQELIGAYRANGLATVGVANVQRAFEIGQVDELVITASPESNDEANELIRQAHNTSAKVRFIEDAALLAPVGGVGAFLRFKL